MSRVFDLGINHSRRELQGYGNNPPDPQWPNQAKICVSFVINYEEGGEHVGPSPYTVDPAKSNYNVDAHCEAFLTESGVASTVPGGIRPARNIAIEQQFEFGAHRGFWRVFDLFKRNGMRFTAWAIGRAVELNPAVVRAMDEARCEVASHSWRWIDYFGVDEATERRHVELSIDAIAKASASGRPPRGWYTGRQSLNTRRLVYEVYRERGLLDSLYDSDAYDEDLPYYVNSPSPSSTKPSPPLLVIPYTLDNNDMKYGIAPGYSTSDDMFTYLKDAFDTLLEEGHRGSPKMMSIGLHCRIVGRPGRFRGIQQFVEYVKKHEDAGEAWVATREEIAEHWRRTFPPAAQA